MSSSGSLSFDTAPSSAAAPFSAALALRPRGDGRYTAELTNAWTVGGGKQHGGLLLALTTRAGLLALDAASGAEVPSEPLAVSADFLRAPGAGPAQLATQLVKAGRTVSVVRVELSQDDRLMLLATVTAGRLPDAPVEWADLPEMAAEPPPEARATSGAPGRVPPLATACEVRIDPATAAFLRNQRGAEPMIRGWARPLGEQPDPLFAVLAGDILPPVLANIGAPGWAPTVQLTALLRARPAPGWLRLESSSRTIAGGWLDEDMIVVDSAGRLVCQARQLALAPLASDVVSA
jgi:acyl-coenzyme A thioesterase PaaI-like protein